MQSQGPTASVTRTDRWGPMQKPFRAALALLLAGAALRVGAAEQGAQPLPATHQFSIGASDFLLDGRPLVIRCGEVHFARVPREYWRHRLRLCRALGLNTVCVYLFWNFHEWEEGRFDWSGQADVADFCRIAQSEGLWVLLRPGPYSCAEWEMGGLPWWLLTKPGMALRSSDAPFMGPATRYLREVGRVLAPLQVTRGGPILMVQVENEYGSYGSDTVYIDALAAALREGGFTVPLFACDPAWALGKCYRPRLFQVVNFGPGSAQASFEALRKLQGSGPLMNGEYYPAWFDSWGRRHRTGAIAPIVSDLDYMLSHHESFSIYMAHGGTSFGQWSGADRPFVPDTSSYDYDAPISEAGWVTPKFEAIRRVIAAHLGPDETLPQAPEPNPVMEIGAFDLPEWASCIEGLPGHARPSELPLSMEDYGQGRGDILYSRPLSAGPAGRLTVGEVHDFAWVYLDGTLAGVLDRRVGRSAIDLPRRDRAMRMDILVEAMGRVNFGEETFDRKGLHPPVSFSGSGGEPSQLTGWSVTSLPFDPAFMEGLRFETRTHAGPGFYRGHFSIGEPADTFLDMRGWGKGLVWVNGHGLGRYWNIGPTQTAYLPGVWLHRGVNEVVVLDLVGPSRRQLSGRATPILDELHPDLDFARSSRAVGAFDAAGATRATGSFAPGQDSLALALPAGSAGRYLCVESLDAFDGGDAAALSDLSAIDARGRNLSKASWRIVWTDSEELEQENGSAENLLDGQASTYWITARSSHSPHPHHVVVDMGATGEVREVLLVARPNPTTAPGGIKDVRVYLSASPFGLAEAADGAKSISGRP